MMTNQGTYRFRFVDLGDPLNTKVSGTVKMRPTMTDSLQHPLVNIVQRIYAVLQSLVLFRKPTANYQHKSHRPKHRYSLSNLGGINLSQSFPGALNGTFKVLGKARNIDTVERVVESASEVFEVESAGRASEGDQQAMQEVKLTPA
jgi:hypothetical protein